MTIAGSIEKYCAYIMRKGYSDQTLASYERQLRQFDRFIDEFYPRIAEITEVKRDIITDYQDYLNEQMTTAGKPLSRKTIQLKLITLRSFFSFLSAEDYIIVDPAKAIVLPKAEQRIPKTILTEREVQQILESCDTRKPIDLRNRAILEVMYACGIRTTELCMLKVSDVDMKYQTLLIEKGKGNVSRLAPLGQYATEYIRDYLKSARKHLLRGKKQDPGFLFLTQHENPFNRKSINKFVMKQVGRKAQIEKDITVYSFRHGIATHLLQRKVDVTYIAQLLGHKSLNTTQQYLKIDISDLKRMHGLYHPRESGKY